MSEEDKKPSGVDGLKPSGLKLPSTIGRLCSNQIPKPAVPSALQKASGSDVSSNGSAAHRNRNPLDSSVVLTEDTDSFKIGDRVWVGGTKPGIIAYIGETQFAPGDWAGLVLDQPVGKNDGSVANIRYFQCDAKRGVFSRLTRLTRAPLTDGGDDHSFLPTSPPSRPPSAAGSRDLRLGDRVIVMSASGSKTGMLRYIGVTDFALGEWCGVELDDPVGKNDGSVQGRRYFSCQPRFGLFAPVGKVSLSPSPNRRPSCAMHPPGPVRQTTKDSITSTASTASAMSRKPSRPGTASKSPSVSNAAEAALRDKEAYIEQLLKERDLERVSVTRAAQLAETAERENDRLKQQLQQLQETAEAGQSDLQHRLSEMQREKTEMKNQLEEEKSKVDDLTFRLDEEIMTRTELETKCKLQDEQIKRLEERLADETKRVEALEGESSRSFEAEEALANTQATLEEAKELLKEQREQCIKWKTMCEEEKQQRLDLENELKKVNEINDQLKTDMRSLTVRFSEVEGMLSKSELECTRLKAETEKTSNQVLKEKESLNQELKELKDKCKDLQDENNNKTNDLSVLNLNLTQLQSKLKNKDDEMASYKEISDKEIITLKDKLKELENTLTSKSVEFEQQEDVLKMEISDLKENLLASNKALEEKDKNNKSDIEESVKQKNVLTERLKEKDEEIASLQNNVVELSNQIETHIKSLNVAKETNKKLTEDIDNLREIEKNVKSLEGKIEELSKHLDSSKQTISLREKEISNYKSTIEELNRSNSTFTVEVEEWKQKCTGLEEKCQYIMEEKNKLESSFSELISSSSDSSQHLNQLNDALRRKEREYASLLEEMSNVRQQSDVSQLTLQNQLEAVTDKAKAEKEEIQSKLHAKEEEIGTISTKYSQLSKEFDDLTLNYKQIANDLKDIRTKLSEETELRTDLENKLAEECIRTNKLKDDIQNKIQYTNELEIELRKKLETLEKENIALGTELKEWRSRDEQTALDMNERRKKEDSLSEKISALNAEKSNLVAEFEEKIAFLSENLDKVKVEKDKFENTICEKDVEILRLKQAVDQERTVVQKHVQELELKDIKIKEITQDLEHAKLSATDSVAALSNERDGLVYTLKEKIDSLSTGLEKAKEEKTHLEKSISDKDSEILNLQKAVEESNHESKRHLIELKSKETQLQDITQEMEKLRLSASISNDKSNEIQEKYIQQSEIINNLKTKLEEVIAQKDGTINELRTELNNIQQKSQDQEDKTFKSDEVIEKLRLLNNETEQRSSKLENDLLETILHFENESKKLKCDNDLLKEEKNLLSHKIEELLAEVKQLSGSHESLKSQFENVRSENNELKNNLSAQTANITNTTTNNNANDLNPDATISFLNSIIADQQRELAVLKEENQQLKSQGQSVPIKLPRAKAPRLFCDICDFFDLHDTEDCPKQGADSPPPKPRHLRKQMEERPYCDSCEMFGHNSGECPDETF